MQRSAGCIVVFRRRWSAPGRELKGCGSRLILTGFACANDIRCEQIPGTGVASLAFLVVGLLRHLLGHCKPRACATDLGRRAASRHRIAPIVLLVR